MSNALDDIRVLDIATLFAGPTAATIMADFGADVIKIEHPAKPDPARTHGQSKNGIGLWWKILGRNKKALTLNLSSPEGQAIFLELVRTADVVIENFRPGVCDRLGVGYDAVAAANPGVVYASLTGFGQRGPWAQQRSYAVVSHAASGLTHHQLAHQDMVGGRHVPAETAQRGNGDFLDRRLLLALRTRDHHVRFEQHALQRNL